MLPHADRRRNPWLCSQGLIEVTAPWTVNVCERVCDRNIGPLISDRCPLTYPEAVPWVRCCDFSQFAIAAALFLCEIMVELVCCCSPCSAQAMAAPLEPDYLRLARFRSKVPLLSQRALSAVLGLSKKEPPPAAVTPRSQRRARDTLIAEPTPFGPLHRVVRLSGGMEAEVQDPAPMLHKCGETPGLVAWLARAQASGHPPPWRVVLYADEVSPGNPLGYVGARKTWAFYWSGLEFGQAA